jgi:hypothetical protein
MLAETVVKRFLDTVLDEKWVIVWIMLKSATDESNLDIV